MDTDAKLVIVEWSGKSFGYGGHIRSVGWVIEDDEQCITIAAYMPMEEGVVYQEAHHVIPKLHILSITELEPGEQVYAGTVCDTSPIANQL